MKRGGFLPRVTPLKRGGRLSPTSQARIADLPRRKEIREAVFARDGGCLMSPWRGMNEQGRDWGPCVGVLTPYHLLKASQGGDYSMDNLITLCSMHNGMVEDFPKAAAALGLVIRSWES
jgi:hypothetical protein